VSVTFHEVAKAADLADGEMKQVELAGKKIALFNLKGSFYAIDDLCTHAFAFLTDGYVEGEEVECPLHAGRFDIRTGKATAPPCTEDVKVYQVKVEGGALLVGV
jgi:nitrite reductase/ring-hydroxylating ferredoxin subunit